MQLFIANATVFLKQKLIFFAHEKLKKNTLKSCSEILNLFFALLPWSAQTAQIEEFVFQNVAYRPTVYKTRIWSQVDLEIN